jgi:transcriptional regulator with XRE-family HTH domain
MELYERLIELRKRENLSQEKLAEILNISRQAVSKWESGASSPDINNIVQLGKIYNVSTDYILLGKSQEIDSSEHSDHVIEKQVRKSKFQVSGFIWLGLSVLTILVLYFITNLP